MPVSIQDVLADLRGTALDERDKGDKFDRLVLNLLRMDPEWVNRFSDVWLWQDWPGRSGRRDTGVDLVAKFRDRDGYAAIQCKFYDAAHRVSKGDSTPSCGLRAARSSCRATSSTRPTSGTAPRSRRLSTSRCRCSGSTWPTSTRRRSTGRSTTGQHRRSSSRWDRRSCGRTSRRR